ncbi:Tensin-2 [Merluccius polli]|uniref:Tensin-2 n=1 Tax=Merluccius polli TaxID=89951 RepID=A0AA47N764_MERPO|nr:Tensin-2 [Merluccius polli]
MQLKSIHILELNLLKLVHLRAPEDLKGVHTHTFKLKPFKKAKSCDICKQAITKEGLICKACRLSCHKKCEVKEVFGERRASDDFTFDLANKGDSG